MKRSTTTLLWALGLLLLCVSVQAAEPQKGQAFYTDVHGAGALIRSMDAMAAIDPAYGEYRDKGLAWFLKQIHTFPTGGRTWLQNPSAPQGHRSYHFAITTISAFNTMTLLQLDAKAKSPQHTQVIKDNVQWFMNGARKKESPYGDVYAWTSRHHLDKVLPQFRPILCGHSWGIGSTLDMLATYYIATQDPAVVPYLIGGARFTYAKAEKNGRGDEERINWRPGDPKRGIAMGYCRGNAGTAFGLIKIAEALPGAQITENHTIEDVVNASLRYILDEAQKNDQGIIWNNMKRVFSKNSL